MDTQQLTKFDISKIPRRMVMHPNWICWEPRPKDNGKVDKIPISPKTLRPAKTNDPATWSDFKHAVAVARDHGLGLGFVFNDVTNLVGIDLDGCVKDGALELWAESILKDTNSYSEITPSGNGLHIICNAKLPGKGHKKGNLEVYDKGRFFTVTGQKFDGVGIASCQGAIDDICKNFFEIEQKSIDPKAEPKAEIHDSDDSILKSLANHPGFQKLYVGDWDSYPSQSEADLAFCSILATRTHDANQIDAIFRQSGLMREKWDQYRGEDTYGEITISKALQDAPPIITSSRNLEVEITPYPDFPEGVLTGLAGDFAKAQAECVEVPEHFLFMAFLTSLGALVSGRATIKNALSLQPRMYTLLLGETSGGRKSTAIKIVTRFFADALKEDDFKISWGFGSAEGLQKRLADAQNLLFCLDEFKSFVSKATIKSSVLLPAVTQLFESNEYENQTKTSHIKIVDGHLSILAASTIDTYTRTWDSSFTDIGFLNRLFLVVGKSERKFAFPSKLDDIHTNRFKAELQAIVNRVYRADRGVLELEFTREAKEIHNQWYLRRESSMYSHRLNVYALRLMILFALNEGKALIDKEIVDKVITLLSWQLEIRRILSPVEGDNPAAILEERIRRMLAAKGDMTKRELRQYTNADRGGLWLFDAALSNLIKAEDVVEVRCNKTSVYHFTGQVIV